MVYFIIKFKRRVFFLLAVKGLRFGISALPPLISPLIAVSGSCVWSYGAFFRVSRTLHVWQPFIEKVIETSAEKLARRS